MTRNPAAAIDGVRQEGERVCRPQSVRISWPPFAVPGRDSSAEARRSSRRVDTRSLPQATTLAQDRDHLMNTTTAVRASETQIDELLDALAPKLGRDAVAYGNHVRRVYGLVAAQRDWSEAEHGQAAVAAVFHDIGIWLNNTFDYLDPSRVHAADYLRAEGLDAWRPLVDDMILEHHKLRPIKDNPLVEAFRRADLCDVSFGLARRRIPRGTYRQLVRRHPIAGFHARLVSFGVAHARKDPRHPLPMLRW